MVEVSEGEEGEGRGPSEAQGPRDRLLHLGASALSDTELLSLLLAAGSRGASSLQRAEWLLETSGGLRALTHRDPAELAAWRTARVECGWLVIRSLRSTSKRWS